MKGQQGSDCSLSPVLPLYIGAGSGSCIAGNLPGVGSVHCERSERHRLQVAEAFSGHVVGGSHHVVEILRVP